MSGRKHSVRAFFIPCFMKRPRKKSAEGYCQAARAFEPVFRYRRFAPSAPGAQEAECKDQAVDPKEEQVRPDQIAGCEEGEERVYHHEEP